MQRQLGSFWHEVVVLSCPLALPLHDMTGLIPASAWLQAQGQILGSGSGCDPFSDVQLAGQCGHPRPPAPQKWVLLWLSHLDRAAGHDAGCLCLAVHCFTGQSMSASAWSLAAWSWQHACQSSGCLTHIDNGSHPCAAGSLLTGIASVSQLVGQTYSLKVGMTAAHLKKVTAS